MFRKTDAVFFDLDDTLYDQSMPFKNTVKELVDAADDLPLDKVFAESRRLSDEVFEQTLDGRMSMESMYIYRVKNALRSFRVNISDEEALAFQNRYEYNQHRISMSEDMEKMLYDLGRCGIKLGIITNGPGPHQWDKIRDLKLDRFINTDYMMVSGDVGVAKPDKRIFLLASEKCKVIPENMLFVGDVYPIDIEGAKSAGMSTLWFNRRNRTVKDSKYADRTVRSETELISVISALTKNDQCNEKIV